MLASHLFVIVLLIGAAAAAVYRRKLTPAAGITGVLTGAAIYAGSGYPGLLLLALFFILGTAATSWGKEKKRNIKGSAAHESSRTPGQVLANAGVAAILGLLIIIIPHHYSLFLLLMAASFSSATADTLSSELGMVYGRRFINILTLKPDQRGLDGVVSLEGTFIGIVGSILIAAAWALATQWSLHQFITIVLAGTFGNLADSALGALFERKGKLGNNTVNFLNTAIAALFALVLS
ncbi:MAG TPA: DUF92 domain-containing protein [Puia sp.]|uniref:DUF92 domain-containing protein n=1 Tax=Puia sp. TaxID=2045100 RepID=UPI002C0925A2|nr:DUF92 domain-containing protein [Puia sp.]HVU98588.1 DUF92 domain-containing protein [Puia sp.]